VQALYRAKERATTLSLRGHTRQSVLNGEYRKSARLQPKGASKRGRGPWRCRLDSERGVLFCCLAAVRQVELTLPLKTRDGVGLTQGLELGPVLAQLLSETALRRNGGGPIGLLVLRAGRRRGVILTPLECLVEGVELRKNQSAGAVVLGA
jgi:hypothetical protein